MPTPVADEDIQATFCATLVDEWVRAGLAHFVVSPGSRSTPLAVAAARHPGVQLSVVLDERSASFVAVGIARATQRAAVLLCTSGTAAVEYHAAVVEADLDHVALIVCTADRPPELHGVGAPQTVVQQGLYGNSLRWSCDPGVASTANWSSWRSMASRCVLAAEKSVRGPGPVHLNLAFREPLLGVAAQLPDARTHAGPWHAGMGSARRLAADDVDDLLAYLSGRRGVLVVGDLGGEAGAVHALAQALQWPVLADVRSGARVPGPHTISLVDLVLREPETATALQPEVVVRLGAPWASKVLAQWLAGAPDDVLVDPFDAWLDPSRACRRHVTADPTLVCEDLVKRGGLRPAPACWIELWRRADDCAAKGVEEALGSNTEQPDLSEPAVARSLLSALPAGAHLLVASSMPVRDLEWFSEARTGATVHANRGANGIDGVVSTIVGLGVGAPDAAVYGLLGDLSFLHDASGLVTAASLGVPVTLVVVDNGGGGIFEFLPQARSLDRALFEKLFGTGQPVNIAAVSRAFGFEVVEVSTLDEFTDSVRSASAQARVILVKTDRVANVAAHDEVYAAVANVLARGLRAADSP